MPQSNTERNHRQYNWQKENTERINILFEKGTRDRIDAVRGSTSISEYIRAAVAERLSQDTPF